MVQILIVQQDAKSLGEYKASILARKISIVFHTVANTEMELIKLTINTTYQT